MTNSVKIKLLSLSVVLCLSLLLVIGVQWWISESKRTEFENNILSSAGVGQALTSQSHFIDRFMNDQWKTLQSPSFGNSSIEDWVNSFFDDAFPAQGLLGTSGLSSPAVSPSVTLEENDNEYKVIVEMPAGEEVELQTNLTDGVLRLSGKIKRTDSSSTDFFASQSLFTSSFSRTIRLSTPVDQGGLRVINDNGVSKVIIPKANS